MQRAQGIWRTFCESYDPVRSLREVKPANLLVFAAFVVAVLAAMTFIPPVQRFTGFEHPVALGAVLLCAIGLDLLAWRFWSREALRHALVFAAMAGYCAFAPLMMLATTEPTRYAFGLLYGQIASDYGRRLSFSWPMTVAASLVPVGITLVAWEDFATVVLAVFGAMMYVYASLTTRGQRRLARENAGLESAFQVADRLASNSVDIAQGSSLAESSALVHHLSNALTPVLHNIRFARTAEGLDPEVEEALADAERNARRSSEILAKWMEVVKHRAQKPVGHFELQRTLRALVEAHESPPGVAFVLLVEEPLPQLVVQGDPEHLRLAFENLVRNAREAGAGRVSVGARLLPAGEGVLVTVRDDGPGIPPELKPRLLHSLVTSSKSDGHGFGLYLSRRLVELLGGALQLAETSGPGACFELRLPGAIPAAPEEAA